jgi:acyl transferase domain-containing protein/3-hydroxymyristoyl/3-hydroxydecanoyl-(acyl carrier protein) dehydratase/1-acyl-sn-glycerol-3-phosphate acyltransferase
MRPIAIVAQACTLPDAATPEALWANVAAGKSAIAPVPEARWGIARQSVMGSRVDHTWSDAGGYVRDYTFEAKGFARPERELLALDPLFHWVLGGVRDTLAGLDHTQAKTGLVLGNLSFPSSAMTRYAESVWLESQPVPDALRRAGGERPHAFNRFTSGLPALLAAKALGLGGGAFALDAACASSLYAIKLACDRLNDGTADLMVAGAVNRADDLFIHIGFCALSAMSRTGQSRPFHQGADGLVPAEGAGFVALRRLDDAVARGEKILGVIRGVGLSNDGRGRGLLAPSEEGQARAIRAAYEMSGLTPKDIGLLECHATGTPVGDATEIRSTAKVFAGCSQVPIGSLKSNLGHLVTVAGVAGLMKVLAAMKHGVRPRTLHTDSPTEALRDTPFRLLEREEAWDGPRRAAISAFGFGGNNAHLIVEAWEPNASRAWAHVPVPSVKAPRIAIVAIGARVGQGESAADFTQALFEAPVLAAPRTHARVALTGLRFPPRDIENSLAQQALVLESAREAAEGVTLPRDRTMVLVGMGCDPEIARYGARWRVGSWLQGALQNNGGHVADTWLAQARDAFQSGLEASGVVGTMPNIPANRINSQLDLGGPGFTVSSEEASGTIALELGARALRAGEVDAVLVGAVDLSNEKVHEAALRGVGRAERSGDGAVVLILKREDDAKRDGDSVLAFLDEGRAGLPPTEDAIAPRFGRAHAAHGLLQVAASALAKHHGVHLRADGKAMPDLDPTATTTETSVLEAESARVSLLPAQPRGWMAEAAPRLYVYEGATREDTLAAFDARREGRSNTVSARLVIVAANEEELVARGALAKRWMLHGGPAPEGVAFRATKLEGDLAFVFTGAAAAYPGMGRELAMALPDVAAAVSQRAPEARAATDWIYRSASGMPQHPLDQLWGTSFVCQMHAELSRQVLRLRPSATIGYSSGESNALFAMGAWTDLGAMINESRDHALFTADLVGEFRAARSAWAKLGVPTNGAWVNFSVAASAEDVRRAIGADRTVHLTIVNTASDCVIGGDADACAAVIAKLGQDRALPLTYEMAAHCPEVLEVRDAWWALHHRKTQDVPGVRFYTNASSSAYQPTAQAAADAITGQAIATMDFTKTIEQAYADGVRVFLEHGPRGLCSGYIRSILGDRDHVAVPLDVAGRSGIRQVMNAVAWLVAAGVDVNVDDLAGRLAAIAPKPPARGPFLNLLAHPGHPQLPPLELSMQTMKRAPKLPSVMTDATTSMMTDATTSVMTDVMVPRQPRAEKPAPNSAQRPAPPTVVSAAAVSGEPVAHPSTDVFARIASQQALLGEVHRNFLNSQTALHNQFLALRQSAEAAFLNAYANASSMQPTADLSRTIADLAPEPARDPEPHHASVTHQGLTLEPHHASVTHQGLTPAPARVTHQAVISAPLASSAPVVALPIAAPKLNATLPGPKYSRAQLEVLASGKISSVFGPAFAGQDAFPRQVRMPEPPLLLADRVTGIDAAPGSMATGTLWTETDVTVDSWYLNDEGRMPTGIMIESGQADLLLISWLGVDMLNRSERVYRLLGCEMTFHGHLPSPGDTLVYDIHVGGHAKQDDVRLFFFHYDCKIRGENRLSVRHGQAGFFTDEELANSAGVLWDCATEKSKDGPLDPPARVCQKSRLSPSEVRAFANGDAYGCFGAGWEGTRSHVRTPRITKDRMLFVNEVTTFDPKGGPWERGYLRAEAPVTPNDWYFAGHFNNDPCMPGTLMFEGCLQTMAVYLAAMGFTVERDGWRFEIVPEEKYLMRCRGQVTPNAQRLVYEVFVSEVSAGPHPTVFADLLCTVDGRKAFHARRVGLRLIPDFPLSHWKNLGPATTQETGTPLALSVLGGMKGHVEEKPVATVDGFRFDYASLLACAWGKPSEAFGPFYKVFDGTRRVARLPGPPYHFMSRIIHIDGPMGGMKAPSMIECEYDVPESAWYFEQNGNATMPFCVLMEAALQPCGWLASFVGSALTTEQDLLFRNLDGTGTVLHEIRPGSGPLRTRATLRSISQTAGMIIESFEVECFQGDRPVYTMKTVFGFFPKEAFENQVGLPVSDAERARLLAPSAFAVDLTARPAKYCEQALRLPASMLLMLDRVTGYWPDAGRASLGTMRAEKTVNPDEWFFKAHFFQDPVQPGSLGVDAMCQLLQFFMVEKDLGKGIENPRFEPVMCDKAVTWKYRGQVVPSNGIITTEIEVLEISEDARGRFVLAEASLWVDGKRIYNAKNLGMRIVSGGAGEPKRPTTKQEETLDPSKDTWLLDHCPTWTMPALPMMSMVDRLVDAASRASGKTVTEIRDLQVHRWLPFGDGPVRMRTRLDAMPDRGDAYTVTLDAWREATQASLSRFEPVASAVLSTAPHSSAAEPFAPLRNSAEATLPYATGSLFHGPAFHYLTALRMGAHGSSATLDAGAGAVPYGTVHQGLLDAATHGIPHDAFHTWDPSIGQNVVAYPYRLTSMRFFAPLPRKGALRLETRYVELAGEGRMPTVDVQVLEGDRVLLAFRLVEILLPKGPLGARPPAERRAFLRDRMHVSAMGLSTFDGTLADARTTLTQATVRESDWLPGNVARIYGVPKGADVLTEVAVRDHVARTSFVHPSTIAVDATHSDDLVHARVAMRPLALHSVAVAREAGRVTATSAAPVVQELEPVRRYWRDRIGVGQWLIEDLYYGLIERFVGDVIIADPADFAAQKGKSCLYLSNHQVGVESLLFSVLASALSATPTLTLAKAEHRTSWLGTLIASSFTYPGVVDPKVIAFFEREDRESLMQIVGELALEMQTGAKSVMVHVEGTRALSARKPVVKMSSAFIDMAIAVGAPIVPVRFAHGLPLTDVERRLEFPVGFGRQDIWIGKALQPSLLAALPYKERKEAVLGALNGLGPSMDTEEVTVPSTALQAEVGALMARTGASEEDAVLLSALLGTRTPCEETRALCNGLHAGTLRVESDARGQWLGQLAKRLYGPKGGQVVGLRGTND